MSADLLQRLLDGRLTDPDGGTVPAVATRLVAIERSLRGDEAALLGQLDLGGDLAVVADPTTWRVLGAQVAQALGARRATSSVILPEHPHADDATVHHIRVQTAAAAALVAVGSGTINDLVKYAAHLDRKPYVCFATAPSMNGYTSLNAAITEAGVKKSLPATAPRGVFFDLEVLGRAPRRMIQAGLGDSICRPTAQADWLLAHLLLGQPYRALPFRLLVEDEAALLADPAPLLTGDPAAMRLLARILVLSGFGMAICGSSHPASQGEHLISHFIEMRGDPAWPPSFHGEQVAVTTLTMARLQAAMLADPAPRVAATTVGRDAMTAYYGAEMGADLWQSYRAKALDAAGAAAMNAKLASDWPEIRRAILAVHRPPAALAAALQRIGAPTRPADIHVPEAFYREAVLHAREIRNRYTFLDFAADAGRLAAAIPGG